MRQVGRHVALGGIGPIVCGTPQQVSDRLNGLREELGLTGILAEMNCGNRIPHQQVLTSLQLLCEEVIPKFKS